MSSVTASPRTSKGLPLGIPDWFIHFHISSGALDDPIRASKGYLRGNPLEVLRLALEVSLFPHPTISLI